METEPEDGNVPIRALRPKTRTLISNLLNPEMFKATKNGTLRYWKGLLGLCDIDPRYTPSIDDCADPTAKILDLWYEKDPQQSTIQQFMLFLEEMGRFDVIEDITHLIDADIEVFRANPTDFTPPNLENDQYILTTDDWARINDGRALEIFDAFVLFDQDDIDFAIQLVEVMEKDHGLKFCVKDRDTVGGGLELDRTIRLITQRCNRVIVILSDAFFKSSANTYYLSFAQAYGTESQRKIIPCVYKNCTLPPGMKFLTLLDHRHNQFFNFWVRLRDSVMVANGGKSKVNRSKSDNGQAQRSALHESRSVVRAPQQAVKFSNSVGDLNSLEVVAEPPLVPSTSADNLSPISSNGAKKKSWFKKIKSHWKKDKHLKRTAAVAN